VLPAQHSTRQMHQEYTILSRVYIATYVCIVARLTSSLFYVQTTQQGLHTGGPAWPTRSVSFAQPVAGMSQQGLPNAALVKAKRNNKADLEPHNP
jgi:hypothetical protein